MSQKSVCVYCGSRNGAEKSYSETAKHFGTLLAQEGWRLVYGAGDVGLMGEVARAAQNAGGETFGVIPVHLVQREVGKTDLTHFVITETMHERKKVMIMNADAVVVLPGGPGSLDELFEALTWRQLGLHDKPIVVVNVNGYWDALQTLLGQVIGQGFADGSLADFITWVEDADVAMAALRNKLN
ncbi:MULTISPECIES: TIGR00730 family Rossman fold protein [unclassified Ruegeria]|uniref:LOG family protein n=1 Tax=unclassified Ruegeria TaxID=2625375 RepID=UPI001487990D|nr:MULTISPECIES: TIGR00730 family Rossman fold protein [unclassified Ruegeria]NOD77387.1 TIGR00730 family Rossman fold protein [Ruegeria sp. HKCCD4332]NOD87810.1 TIGR00730 family Rossman fold protein [Ruegeria sp. HKCCD4318]NOE14180.1 TIGR00730 family Rossman fold protein [Ruegeria sp. HKCCD4318-2]NOG08463.1 TIGR00730 family Rossman fold protein [Ruegeria sp. HKCCD4315]